MEVVIISATENEVLLIKRIINPDDLGNDAKFKISFLVTGVGMLPSCFCVSKLIFERKPDLIIQAGIAGTFNSAVKLGEVVIVKEDILADTGVEEDGSFKDVFDLNLAQPDSFPFFKKRLLNPEIEKLNFLGLKEVTGITINEITTRLQRIIQYKAKYNPDIESMEGASLHYCCLQTSTSFIQLRAISNYIGERDKSKWNFEDSFKNLSETIKQYIDHLYKTNQYKKK
ncbi:futalosine hydrolase [Segetibacter koreensis]|uniref:futalosine hydrolase n=1 Tax=Segetibacter koreensis TaxID=398037 RepID=UPI00036F1D7C|nr:futalosine hydrolase [Segetibacter koreensis]